jgi:hypothetical protein
MKHKHAEIIAAYIDGIQCEYYSHELKKWGYVTQLDTFDWAHTVRIKPEPVEQYQPNIQISQLENQLQACRALVKAQEKKIVELATELAFANKSIEILNVEEEEYLYVYNNINTNNTWMSPTLMMERYGWIFIGKVRVEK